MREPNASREGDVKEAVERCVVEGMCMYMHWKAAYWATLAPSLSSKYQPAPC